MRRVRKRLGQPPVSIWAWGSKEEEGIDPKFLVQTVGGRWCWGRSRARGKGGWDQVWERDSESDLGPWEPRWRCPARSRALSPTLGTGAGWRGRECPALCSGVTMAGGGAEGEDMLGKVLHPRFVTKSPQAHLKGGWLSETWPSSGC